MAKKNSISSKQLKKFVRRHAKEYLAKSNINSIGIGYKIRRGRRTKELSIQFTVDEKAVPERLEALDTTLIPETIQVDGIDIPTDVLQRSYRPGAKPVQLEAKLESSATRKSFIDPIVPV